MVPKSVLGIVGGKPSAELNERTSGQIILFVVDIQCVPPSDVEAESVERFLITEVVPLLQKRQTEKTGNTEVGTAGCAIEHTVVIFVPEEDGKDFEPEEVAHEDSRRLRSEGEIWVSMPKSFCWGEVRLYMEYSNIVYNLAQQQPGRW